MRTTFFAEIKRRKVARRTSGVVPIEEAFSARAVELIDEQVRQYVEEKESAALREDPEHGPIIRRLSDQSNRTINTWHSFCEKDYRRDWDSRCQLNQKVIFSNTEVKRDD